MEQIPNSNKKTFFEGEPKRSGDNKVYRFIYTKTNKHAIIPLTMRITYYFSPFFRIP